MSVRRVNVMPWIRGCGALPVTGMLTLAACNPETMVVPASDRGRFLAAVAQQGCSFAPDDPPSVAILNGYGRNPGMDRTATNDDFWTTFLTNDLIEDGLLVEATDSAGRPRIVSTHGACAASAG